MGRGARGGFPGVGNVLGNVTGGNVAHTVRLLNPAPGRFVFARGKAIAKHKGWILVTVHPNARGRWLMAHHTYRPTFRLWITYTPVGGRSHSIGYYGLHLPT